MPERSLRRAESPRNRCSATRAYPLRTSRGTRSNPLSMVLRLRGFTGFSEGREYDAGIRYLYHAIGKKAVPQEKARMYGMWFSDYHPYFLLAKASSTRELPLRLRRPGTIA